MRPVCLLMMFFTLYTTLPHNLMKDKLIEVVCFSFLDGDVPCSASCGSVALKSFAFLEHLAVLMASALAANCLLRDFLGRAVGVINFAKPFLDFIDNTMV